MNSPKVSYFSKTLLSFIFIAGLILTPNLVRAQEQTDEEKEYKMMQDIQAEKDPAQKADLAIKFLKEKPKSTYRPYVVPEFQRAIVDLQKEKKWAQVISVGEKFISIAPDDSITVKALAAAYGSTNNMKGFATYGEKAYASAPSPDLALQIAKAYREIGNEAKYQQWAQKTLAVNADNVDLLADMIRKALGQNDFAQASKHANAMLKALPTAKKPDSMGEQEWKNAVDVNYAISYAAIGATAFNNKRYTEAIKNLDSAVKYYKRMDMAYYFLGMAYWQQQKIAAAELNFAKAYLLKGTVSGQAKKYLDQLWSNSHRGSLAGMETVIARAQLELK
jgi:tetratricopeptide (TPR) repeat protein